jgi:hypothetical protein
VIGRSISTLLQESVTGNDAYLLSEEDIIVFPVFRDAEALMKSSVFVSFSKQPRGVHEIFSSEVFSNFLVPESDIGFVVIDDGSEFAYFPFELDKKGEDVFQRLITDVIRKATHGSFGDLP